MRYGQELSHAEDLPKVLIYCDSTVESTPIEVDLTPSLLNDAQEYDVVIRGKYNGRKELPRYAKILFYASATRLNEFGSPCPVDGGLGMISLKDMLDPAKTLLQEGGGQVDVPLLLYTCNRLEKGRLRLTRRPGLISSRIKWASDDISANVLRPIQNRAASVLERLDRKRRIGDLVVSGPSSGAEAARLLSQQLALLDLPSMAEDKTQEPLAVELEMWSWIQTTQGMEEAMPNTDPETGNVRVPFYYGDTGMHRKVPLPAGAFLLFQTPRSNALFWINMIDVVLRRDNKSGPDVSGFNLIQRARLMVEMCCGLVQSLDYIGDFVDTNRRYRTAVVGFLDGSSDVEFDPRKVSGCERFGDALRDTVGDCEDLALAIIMVFTAFLEAVEGSLLPGNAIFGELYRIAMQYVAFVTLDSVTAMAVKAPEDRGRDETGKRKLGAHMAVKFFPAPYVSDGMRRTAEEEGRGQDNTPFVPFSADAEQLPIMVGEGTGMFECWGIESDPISGERNCVYLEMSSFAFAKKPIVHPPRSEFSFYVGSQIGLTNYWYRLKHNLGGVWFGYTGRYADPRLGDGGKTFQRGVKFVDMQKASPRMCIKPHPLFSDTIMAWLKIATRIRVPPRDLVLTEEGIASHPVKNLVLERVVDYVDALGRKRLIEQPAAPVYVRDYQLTPKIVENMLANFDRVPAITDVSYQLESLTNWAYSYRVGVHANVRNAATAAQ